MSNKDDMNIIFDSDDGIPDANDNENNKTTEDAKKTNLPKIYHILHLIIINLMAIIKALITVFTAKAVLE